MAEATANIGVIGLAAMGSNLARNLAHHGNTVALFNRHYSRTEKLMNEHGTEGNFVPAETLKEFAASLKRPRTAIIMVKAGAPTDATIEQLEKVFEPGDIIVDGGNSFFKDTIKREKEVRAKGFHFVGCGVSGGEEGALNGPSLMPGGTAESWKTLGPILESIAAKVNGEPCVTHHRHRWCRPLRQDGAQRHRIRRYAGDWRGLRHSAPWTRHGRRGDRRCVRGVEQGRP